MEVVFNCVFYIIPKNNNAHIKSFQISQSENHQGTISIGYRRNIRY